MKNLLARLASVEGDATKQLLDLFSLLGYFGVVAYAGGSAYSIAYSRVFSLDPAVVFPSSGVVALFLSRVLFDSPCFLAATTLVGLPAFVVLYYSARYVWRPWFGFASLAFVFYAALMFMAWWGHNRGREHALDHWLAANKELPSVSGCAGKFDGDERLLLQAGGYLYAFEPVAEGSQLVVMVTDCDDYELTIDSSR